MCTAPLGPRTVAADLADAHSIIPRFAELASKRDTAGTLAMFDVDTFVDRVTEGTTLPGAAERARLSFRVALERAFSHGWQWHRWRVVDAVPEKDGMIIAMEGTTVGLVSQRHQFWVRPVDGEQRIYDLYDVALGQRLWDLVRELAVAMHNPP